MYHAHGPESLDLIQIIKRGAAVPAGYHNIIFPDVLQPTQDLDGFGVYAVLPKDNPALHKAEQPQELHYGPRKVVGQRKTDRVYICAHLILFGMREQIIQQVFVLDGKRLAEDILLQQLYQHWICVEIDKNYTLHIICGIKIESSAGKYITLV